MSFNFRLTNMTDYKHTLISLSIHDDDLLAIHSCRNPRAMVMMYYGDDVLYHTMMMYYGDDVLYHMVMMYYTILFEPFDTLCTLYSLLRCTEKPPNRGRFGDEPFVPCRDIVLFSEVLF